MSETNKAHRRRVIEEVYNQGNLDVVDEVAARNRVIRSPTQEGAKHYVAALRAGFPDIRLTIEDHIAEGDKVVTRWTAGETHAGSSKTSLRPAGSFGCLGPASSTARSWNAGLLWMRSA
ncbi:MAG: ester cyclase [Hyphomicrobiaceae bacterium]